MNQAVSKSDADSASSDAVVDAVVDEFVTRLERGDQPQIDEYLQRHPDRAETLRDLLHAAEAMSSLARNSVDSILAGRANLQPTVFSEIRELGDFRLLREIGRGGMGVVYEAEQLSLGRRVALKVLPFAALLDPRHLQRFKNEARAAATLDHPHIVRIYTVGQDRGVHFYAMQLIEGQSLAELLNALPTQNSAIIPPATTRDARLVGAGASQSGFAADLRLRDLSTQRGQRKSTAVTMRRHDDYRQIARWIQQAAVALEHAHQMGIVHRDIKPSNLLINEEGNLWVADFGLALTRADANLTMTGDVLGTLRYMSPEQALGQRAIIDQRTDVYSLGMTLYELLALRPAFTDVHRGELLRQIEHSDPPSIRLVAPRVPVELETIVFKAINKDPASRYLTAAEFAEDLQRFLSDQPIFARPPTRLDRAAKWMKRHRALTRGLLFAVVLTTIGAIVANGFVIRAQAQAAVERAARQAEATTARYLRQQVRHQEYAAQIALAERALLMGHAQEARRLLEDCVPQAGEIDLRGIEWDYLSRRTKPRLEMIGRHKGPAYHVQPSPREDVLASAGQDGIRIWNCRTGQQRAHLTLHQADVNSTGFSPDGELMVSTSDDDTAVIWNTDDWTPVRKLPHPGRVIGGLFTPDGQWLLTCARSEELSSNPSRGENVGCLWNVATWGLSARLTGHRDRIAEIALSEDGRRCATVDRLGVVNVWSVPEGTLLYSLQHSSEGPKWAQRGLALAFARRQPWLATTGVASTVHLWNADNGAPLARLRTMAGDVRSVVFTPDDKYLVIGGGQEVRGWMPLANGDLQEIHSVSAEHNVWWTSAFNSGDVAIADHGGIIYRWRMDDRSHQRRVRSSAPGTIAQAAVSPDGRWLASTANGLAVYPLAHGRGPEDDAGVTLASDLPADNPVAFSPCGQYLVSSNADVCTVWSTATWRALKILPPLPGPLHSLHFERNHRELVAEDVDRPHRYRLEFPAGNLTATEKADVTNCLTLPNNRRLEINARSGLWTVTEGNRMIWTHKVVSYCPTMAVNSDGSRLAFGRNDGNLVILNAASGNVEAICPTTSHLIRGLAFSPDGRTLASWAEPRFTITLSHVATGRELLTISPGMRVIRTVAFTPDCKWLIVSGQNLAGYGEVQLLACHPDA